MTRESMEFDVLIVGGGPAGLSAAIHLAQLNKTHQQNRSICLIEKGASIGAHLISGAVLEPISLNTLLPNWSSQQQLTAAPVTEDRFYYLTKNKQWRLPTPSTMKNKGNYIISLEELSHYLAEQAEHLGVNIFPGFAGRKILYNAQNQVIGVETGDMGLDATGNPSERFQAGIQLLAKQTLFAEGCRGSLTQKLIKKFHLNKHSNPQTYAIGIKELWKIDPKHHRQGRVIHTIGWPLDSKTYGGSFIYHFKDNLLALGLVIGLDYQNPYLDPFLELQRFKTHPLLRTLLTGGECLQFGARALNEGGFQSIPQLSFPGGVLIGCAAGFVNVGKIKGIHNAIQSGMLAAEAIFEAPLEPALKLKSYDNKVKQSTIKKELYKVRNLRPAFRYGLFGGLIYAGIDQYLLRGRAPWTLHHKTPDHLSLKPANTSQKIHYPKPDGTLTFDRPTQVYRTGTKHRENEPCHLLLKDPKIPTHDNLPQYNAPEQRYCPTGVYEIINPNKNLQLIIHATNCIHCKVCDIKDPKQNIVWTVPEGGDGPNYKSM